MMIEISKHDDNNYVAIMDIQTFESYGLNIESLDNASLEVEGLINEIMELIFSTFGDFGEMDNKVCGVGIVVDKELNRVIIGIGNGAPNIDLIHEHLDGHSDGVDKMYNDIENSEAEVGYLDDDLDEDYTSYNYGNNNKMIDLPEKDYSEGIIVEMKNIEDVISLSKKLKLDKDDCVSLYEDKDYGIYYVVIDKTVKLYKLIESMVDEDAEADVIEAIEYDLSEELFEEYEVLRSYFEEHSIISNKTIGYMDEYCKLLIKDNAFKELKKYFK